MIAAKCHPASSRSGPDMPSDRATDFDRANDLRARALHARLHARNIGDQEAANRLSAYADELEAQAAALEANLRE